MRLPCFPKRKARRYDGGKTCPLTRDAACKSDYCRCKACANEKTKQLMHGICPGREGGSSRACPWPQLISCSISNLDIIISLCAPGPQGQRIRNLQTFEVFCTTLYTNTFLINTYAARCERAISAPALPVMGKGSEGLIYRQVLSCICPTPQFATLWP